MNILYLHQYFTTPDYCGGVRSYQFAKRLVESGHSVDMLTSTAFFPVPRKKYYQLISKHAVDGIKVHAIHIAYGNNMSFMRRVIAFLLFMLVSSVYAFFLRKIDLVFATSTPLTIAVPALTSKWVHRVPLVFEVRDLWPDVPIAMGLVRNRWAISFLRWFEMLVYRQARKIVVLSTGMQEELLKKAVAAEKIIVVPNACDIAEFEQDRPYPDALSVLKSGEGTRLCLYAGTFGYVNDLSYLIKLAAEIKENEADVKFILIGDGVEKDMLVEQIRKKGLQEQVVIYDPVSKAQLVDYIKSVDACVSTVRNIPALFNNSANKFFDSLAAGKPIIINHRGWQADLVEKHKLGIVLNGDIQESARRLIEFLFDNASHAQEEILTFAQNNYSREFLYDKFHRLAIQPFARNNNDC